MKRMVFTQTQLDYIESQLGTKSFYQIAKEFNLIKSTFLRMLKRQRPDIYEKGKQPPPSSRKRNFTPEQVQYIKENAHRKTLTQIAQDLGIGLTQFFKKLKRELPELHKQQAKQTYPIEVFDKAVELLNKNQYMSIKEAARRVGIKHVNSLSRFLKSLNLLEKFAKRRKSTPTNTPRRETLRAKSRIRLVVGDIYLNTRSYRLGLAIAPDRIFYVDKNGVERVRKPHLMDKQVEVSVEEILENWGVSQVFLDNLIKDLWKEELKEEEKETKGHSSKRKKDYEPIRYRTRLH